MKPDLLERLEHLYATYHRREHVHLDPLVTLYRYDDVPEREVAGLIAALLAYGNVKAILRGIEAALARMDHFPRAYLLRTPPRQILRDFADFRYRVTGPRAMAAFLLGVRQALLTHDGLEACFASHLHASDQTVVPALQSFVRDLSLTDDKALYHFLPDPARGSACKRLMLYLRWMVRKDAIDPGGWSCVRPGQLVIPLDTHVQHMAIVLRLTRRRQADMKTAMEVTQSLRSIRPDDPLRYDFALTRPGILGHVISKNDFPC